MIIDWRKNVAEDKEKIRYLNKCARHGKRAGVEKEAGMAARSLWLRRDQLCLGGSASGDSLPACHASINCH